MEYGVWSMEYGVWSMAFLKCSMIRPLGSMLVKGHYTPGGGIMSRGGVLGIGIIDCLLCEIKKPFHGCFNGNHVIIR